MINLESVFQTAHRLLKPHTPIPQMRVEFFPFAGLSHTARLREGHLTIRISDIFRDAPFDVYHSLAVILLARLYRKKIDAEYHRIYRLFILGEEIQQRVRDVRHTRSRIIRRVGALGRHIDLNDIFDLLNAQYFGGSMDKPGLSWSAKQARCILGRYDSTHHTIFISRLFDSPDIPAYVISYVMFHEMLHVKHQSRVHSCRVVVHTPEFKTDERTFQHYHEARIWLKRI